MRKFSRLEHIKQSLCLFRLKLDAVCILIKNCRRNMRCAITRLVTTDDILIDGTRLMTARKVINVLTLHCDVLTAQIIRPTFN